MSRVLFLSFRKRLTKLKVRKVVHIPSLESVSSSPIWNIRVCAIVLIILLIKRQERLSVQEANKKFLDGLVIRLQRAVA